MAGDFVWPPRAPETRVESPRGAPAEARAKRAVAAARVAEPLVATPRRGLIASIAGALADAERVWLDLRARSVGARIDAGLWTPDTSDEFCARCGGEAGPHESARDGCHACSGVRLRYERVVRLGAYEGELASMVREVKFGRWRRLGDDLGRLLGERVEEAIREHRPPGADRAVIVPIPTTLRRRMARGIDQARVLARGVAHATGLPIAAALERSHRPSQVSLPPSRRASNVAGTMRRRRGWDLEGRLVVLVDDVRTTGATLAAAAGAVCKEGPGGEPGPAAVWAAVAAVTPGAVAQGRPTSARKGRSA